MAEEIRNSAMFPVGTRLITPSILRKQESLEGLIITSEKIG